VLGYGTAVAQPSPNKQAQVIYFQKPADSLVPLAGSKSQVAAAPQVTLPETPAAVIPAASMAHQPDDKKIPPKSAIENEEEDRKRYVQPPAVNEVFALPNDAKLERIILGQLKKKYGPEITFPAIPLVGEGIAYVPKTVTYPPSQVTYVPGYVVHRRLHFEEKKAERYGWDLGYIQPLVSSAYFFKDVLLWPNSLASGVAYGFWDTNAGKCLPGSPTPYMFYPPGLTITGTAFEGVVITGAAFIIP
jgi:hypothetical protein